ncbi:MAG: beta-propeller fold lactonase family protein [Chthoniobacter sp.]|nr:beta-propeller fold lactonase family protein [Chthoniobacter sp.]
MLPTFSPPAIVPCLIVAVALFGTAIAQTTVSPNRPPAATPTAAKVERVGKSGENRWLLPTGQMIAPAGKQIDMPTIRPQALTLSPNGRFLAVAGSSKDVFIFDAATGEELSRATMPGDVKPAAPPTAGAPALSSTPAPANTTAPKKAGDSTVADVDEPKPDAAGKMSFAGLAFSPDGGRLFVSSRSGQVRHFTVDAAGKLKPAGSFALPNANAPQRREDIATGLALSADGHKIYACASLGNRLQELDATTGKLLRQWNTGIAPLNVVLAGSKAYVSCLAGPRPKPGDLAANVGRGVLAIVDDHSITSVGSVVIIDLAAGKVLSEIETGLHCGALAVSPNGEYVVAANAGSDTLSVIATTSGTIVEKIWARATPADPFGAQPSALAFDPSGKTLYVANGTQNAVAVIKFDPSDKESRVLGLIPTAWFPAGLAFDPLHKALLVANLRGVGSAKIFKATDKPGLSSKDFWGTLSFVPVPDSITLAALTRTALEGIRHARLAAAALLPRPETAPRPVPERAGEPSVFKHVIYVIKENRSYDQVLGDMKEGNGAKDLCTFGEKFTPNQHALAREFVLLDNTYCNSVQSADGHQWTDSGIANEYTERQVVSGFPRSYGGGKAEDGSDALTWASSGFIWDHVTKAGKTFRNFGEWMVTEVKWNDPTKKDKPSYQDITADLRGKTGLITYKSRCVIPALAKLSDTDTVGWDLNVPDQFRADKFIEKLKGWETDGKMPDMVYLFLPNDHTGGTRGNAPTPGAQIADNDLAFGRIVEALSHSKFWADTVLLAVEDDPQAGWDHVSGYRTTCYVASAYTKRHQTVSTHYNHSSLLRTIELILGLPTMNQMTAAATPMFDAFNDQPDLTPFKSVPNQVPLDDKNPDPKKIANALMRELAEESEKLALDVPDAIEEGALNRILWHAMKGPDAPFPHWAISIVEDDD